MSIRYQRLFTKLWADEKVRALPPLSQRFFLYLMSNEQTNLVGIYQLRDGYVCEDLECSASEFQGWLADVVGVGLVSFDPTTRLVLIRGQLKHTPITNKNQLKAAVKWLEGLPKSKIINDFKSVLSTSEVLRKGLHKELSEVLRNKEVEVGIGVETTSIEVSTRDKHSTSSLLLPCEEREEGEDGFSVVQGLHFEVFGMAIKGDEWGRLKSFPLDRVIEKYREARSRCGTDERVRSFSWIVNGLEGRNGESGKGRGLFGRIRDQIAPGKGEKYRYDLS